MEYDGTPPAANGYLLDEVESPSYHSGRALRTWSQASVPTNRAQAKNFSNSGQGRQGSQADDTDIVRLLEEHWYWQSNSAAPTRPYGDAWQASKANRELERQRSLKHGTWRSFVSQSSNPSTYGRTSKEPPRLESRDNQTVASFRSTADGESDADESEFSGPVTRDMEATTPECNPEDVDSIGTWAQRVLFFDSKKAEARDAEAKERMRAVEEQKPTRESEQQAATDGSPARSKRQSQALRRQDSKDEEEAAHAAWRWRFNRRWRHEQAKQLDPDFGMDGGDEDGWEDALVHLDACGPGVHLQIGRMSSDKPSGSLMSAGSSGFLFENDSFRDKALAQETGNATNNIASKAKKVQELYQKQNKIEKEVKARWGGTDCSQGWAGSHIRAVEIDSYGHFPFLLAKLFDNSKAHRLVVRGHQNRSPKDQLKALNAEVEAVCTKRRLPKVKVLLLGTGMMEWSRENDHRINVSQGVAAEGCEAIQSKDDVLRVAGALTRSSLSGPTRVTVNGERLS